MTQDQHDEGVEAPPSAEPETPEKPSTTPAKSARGGSVVAAAMLGLGEVLEPEKTQTDVVIQQSLDDDDDLGRSFDLDFGQLDDLDPPR